jgi:hypothetical protein
MNRTTPNGQVAHPTAHNPDGIRANARLKPKVKTVQVYKLQVMC